MADFSEGSVNLTHGLDWPLIDTLEAEKAVVARSIQSVIIEAGRDRPKPAMARPVPAPFVERKQLLAEVLKALQLEETPTYPICVALKGMGGIGKSMLARPVANSPEMTSKLTEWTLWVGLRF